MVKGEMPKILPSRFRGHLSKVLGHFSFDHRIENEPLPSTDGVVNFDVPLNRREQIFLRFEVVVLGELHEDDSGGTLHLQDNLRQSAFADLLQAGQASSAEHDLGVSASELVGVETDFDECFGGATL